MPLQFGVLADPLPLEADMFPRFEQFISEKQYLLGVSPATVEWYRQSLRWLCAESPTDTDLKDSVLRMRTKGLKPSACNSYIRAINSFLHWNAMGTDVKCSSVCKHPRLMSLKEPTLVLPVYTAHQVQRLVGFRPKGFYERRMHLLVLILLDTGCRISEALGLHVADIDLDNLLMILDGKGGKQRKVPFSMELRKGLFRYTREFCAQPHMLVLGTVVV
jgi:integrase/recombinase XerD